MYIIAVYDVNEKRVGKALRLCRRYLTWIQNSVFEGELSGVQLQEFKLEMGQLLVKSEDSLIIFTSRNPKWMDKEIMGVEKNSVDNFL